MTTAKGTELYFDEHLSSYMTTDIQDVRESLEEDINNYQLDPVGAEEAYRIKEILDNIDRKKGGC